MAIFTRFGGLSHADAEKLCKDSFKDVLSGKVHAYNRLWYVESSITEEKHLADCWLSRHVVGRKPEKGK